MFPQRYPVGSFTVVRYMLSNGFGMDGCTPMHYIVEQVDAARKKYMSEVRESQGKQPTRTISSINIPRAVVLIARSSFPLWPVH